ncbi:PcfB family protein [Bacillus thuringiensis]|uniref:PcfB family protein n=1 Tax=Bacillus thuringiensis TaxID=1428 RepID=UPI0020D27EB7|nr:PcfB family protein [Bacillus thuringiensis]
MVSVDEHTQVAIEVVAQSLKISEQTLLRILQALSKLLEGKEQQPKDFILDDKTKVGKQKISDLMKKHEKTGGIVALDENLTKQQLNDYQKELKKLGVDFSVVRNGKEDYSFFFSATQANVIEKAFKNIVKRKSAVLEKEEGHIVFCSFDLEDTDRQFPTQSITYTSYQNLFEEQYKDTFLTSIESLD